jgi:hypothetical protein
MIAHEEELLEELRAGLELVETPTLRDFEWDGLPHSDAPGAYITLLDGQKFLLTLVMVEDSEC